MRFLLKVRLPIDAGNAALVDPQFGEKMQRLLTEINAEAAYFTTVDGQRGGYVIVNMNDAAELPAVAEPLFMWLKADIECHPVMLPEDLARAEPAIAAAKEHWWG